LLVPGENYYWGKNAPKGYRIEARLPWTLLAEQTGDSLFVPREGYRVPLDIMINDADQSGVRESMLELSPFSDGHSAVNPALWVYTWIGDKWQPATGVEKDQTFAHGYALAQNYPNPFNPSTRIKYTVGGVRDQGPGAGEAGAGVSGLGTSKTSLIVYDLLGRQVAVLVNERKSPGSYEVSFDGRGLSSGVYFYRLTAGPYVASRKMLLVR
jgi:hypothetical protein